MYDFPVVDSVIWSYAVISVKMTLHALKQSENLNKYLL